MTSYVQLYDDAPAVEPEPEKRTVRQQSEHRRQEKSNLADLMRAQLRQALAFVCSMPIEPVEVSLERYSRQRRALVEAWDGPEKYSETVIEPVDTKPADNVDWLEDDGQYYTVVWTITVPNKYYIRHMGAYVDEEPWWQLDYADLTTEAILEDGNTVEMGDGTVAFPLEAVRTAIGTCKLDFRLIELSDYKLSQLLQGSGCHKIRLERDSAGHRKRYMSAWSTDPRLFDSNLLGDTPPRAARPGRSGMSLASTPVSRARI